MSQKRKVDPYEVRRGEPLCNLRKKCRCPLSRCTRRAHAAVPPPHRRTRLSFPSSPFFLRWWPLWRFARATAC